MTCYVYFAQSKLGDGIKVGISKNPARRMSNLTATLLATVECPNADEARRVEETIHKLFDDDRLAGEYFSPSPALLVLIECATVGTGAGEVVRLVDEANELPEEFAWIARGVMVIA